MSDEINRINPTVVEGAEDIHGAETFDADYSPLNRPSFRWRDNMAQSRRTLDEKQVGDMMRMRRMGRGRYDAEETFNAPLSKEQVEKLQRKMSYAKGSRPSMRPVENRLAVGQRMKGSMASEGFSDVLGTLIPQPHFVGFEEIQREKMKNQNMKDAESCGNCGSALVMNAEGEHGCGCGTEMEAEETMLGSIGEGNDFGQMEAETFGAEYMKGWKIERPFEDYIQATKENPYRSISIIYNKGDYEPYLIYRTTGSGEYYFKTLNQALDWLNGDDEIYEGGKDFRNAEEFGAERRYRYGNRYITRDSKGRFKKNVDVGRSLSADRRRKAKTVKGVGQGGTGDYGAESFEAQAGSGGILYDDDNNGSMVLKEGWTWLEGSPHNEVYYGNCDSCSEKLDAYYTGYVADGTEWSICIKCFDKMPGREGVMIEHQNGKKSVDFKNTYNAEETMLGSIGGGNDFGQMEAEGDVVDLTQGVLAKGGVRVGGMTASAIVLAIAGLSGYYYARK